MDFILGLIGELGLWALGFGALVSYWLFIFAGLHEEASRKTRDRWIRRMRDGDWGVEYRVWLSRCLDAVDRWLTPELAEGTASFGPSAARAAWSAKTRLVTLKIALIYPLLALTIQWTLTGTEMALGQQFVIVSEKNTHFRFITVIAITSLLFFIYLPKFIIGYINYNIFIFFILTFYLITEYFGIIHNQWIIIFSILICAKKYIQFYIFMIITTFSIINFLVFGFFHSNVLIFVVMLPLLNAITDYGSIGLTRWLLRRGWPFTWSWLADIVGAAFFLLLFGIATIGFITLVTPQDGTPLLDLPLLFADIRTRPEDHWWLAFMVFSTLIPTLLHLILALSSTILLTPKNTRHWIAAGLEAGAAGDLERGRNAKLALAGFNSLAMWWPACLILYGGWWVWTANHGIRDGLLWLAEGYHRWLSGLAG